MSEAEGTIQFAYSLEPLTTPLPATADVTELAAWRSILQQLTLLGQTPDRYEGNAYGNLSYRHDGDPFVITASQTSGEPTLLREHLVLVQTTNLGRFWVEAYGTEPPSSESLTHAMIYTGDRRVNCIFHVHSPVIWHHRQALGMPETSADVGYGSPQMAVAVHELLEQHQSRPLVFATAGHEDGIFALGFHPRDCGGLLLAYLAKARGLDTPLWSDEPA